jgi:hypothetical protein
MTAHQRAMISVSTSVSAAISMESKMSEEQRVEEQRVRQPAQTPAPTAKSEQAAEESSKEDAGTEADPRTESTPRGRIPQRGICAIRGLTPYRVGVILRRIDVLRVGGRDLDRALPVLYLGGDNLLLRALQLPGLLRPGPHSLDRIHHVCLLSQKRVAEVGGPTNIAAQDIEHIRESGQSLDARVPVLLLGGFHTLIGREVPVLL